MADRTIGEQELALVRHVAEVGGATVGEVAAAFGETRGLARSTVLTMMERLRKKGYLTRRLQDGLYRYQARSSSAELAKSAVRRFVERSLDGSISPLVAYLTERTEVSDDELKALQQAVARLKPAGGKESRS